MARPKPQAEMAQFTIYCDVELIRRIEKVAKKLGQSRNQMAVFLLDSSVTPVEKMDSFGMINFLMKQFAVRAGSVEDQSTVVTA